MREELQARVSQICHLRIDWYKTETSFHLPQVLEAFASPAPALEYLSLSKDGGPSIGLPHTLFSGAAPRLSSLNLRNFDISWESPLLKGIRYLEIRSPSATAWPNSLNALREMPQLEKLVLHSPSLMPNPFQSTSDVQSSVSLPSLTHMDISAAAGYCVLVLSHLSLPALTRLRVTLDSHFPNGSDIPDLLPALSRHAHGPQDTEPLQSVLISNERDNGLACATILAWPMHDVNTHAVHNQFTLLPVALSITINDYSRNRDCLDRAMVALPLESIVTLTARHHARLDEQFWLRYAPTWPLLQCVWLTAPEARGFIEMLLQDDNGRENPLLPSLTKLALMDVALSARRTRRLCDVLMKRVEQGVPLETLDLRNCTATKFSVRLLSEIVVDVWSARGFEPYGVEWDTSGGPSFSKRNVMPVIKIQVMKTCQCGDRNFQPGVALYIFLIGAPPLKTWHRKRWKSISRMRERMRREKTTQIWRTTNHREEICIQIVL
jgi:hypothetical protein